MNDVRFAVRQLLKNPGFTAVAVLTLALGIAAKEQSWSLRRHSWAAPSVLGLIALGIEQTHPRDLPGIHQVPMNANPDHKELGSSLRWDGKVFGMSDWQHFAIGQMQLEGPEWRSITHFLEVCNGHILGSMLSEFSKIFN